MVGRASAGELLRRARVQAGLSQSQLAHRAGVTQSVISVYESGLRQPSLPTLAALVEATGAALDVRLKPSTETSASLPDRVMLHASEIKAMAERHGVRVLGVFGSVARGDDHPGSDVDVLVDVPDGVGLLTLGRLEEELRQIVGADVDLVPASGLKEHVRDAALADLVPL